MRINNPLNISNSKASAGLYTAIFDGTLANLASVRIQYIATRQAGVLNLLGFFFSFE